MDALPYKIKCIDGAVAHIRPACGRDMRVIEMAAAIHNESREDAIVAMQEAYIRKLVVGLEGVKDKAGKPVASGAQLIERMDDIPNVAALYYELVAEVINQNKIDEDEEKNSEAPPDFMKMTTSSGGDAIDVQTT